MRKVRNAGIIDLYRRSLRTTARGSTQTGKIRKGRAKHRFEQYCEEKRIKLKFAHYNHPQSNGKVERFSQTYQRFRGEFASVEKFRGWYNKVRPHFSSDLESSGTSRRGRR